MVCAVHSACNHIFVSYIYLFFITLNHPQQTNFGMSDVVFELISSFIDENLYWKRQMKCE